MCELISGLTLATALQGVGLAASVVGPMMQAQQASATAQVQARAYEQQRDQQQILRAVEEQRTRRDMAREVRRQASQFAVRGVETDSPTAIYLGQTAAEEMVFAAQSVRQGAMAEATELTNEARLTRARGQMALTKGMFSAAGNLLTGAPKVWPELLA
ncbi:hypothetical protein [Mameliella alba]|uniref:Uncharacterized protein n=1 Tax=Mameliella alba TaxID=561184 RepID=A0A0B3RQW2_9RHOB|nr:hypothetical protein [Mameliella alba]KHQ50277.1 hypothetical protein OA50_05125 [Mameliella alba]